MDSLFLLIPIALILTAIAIKAFFWAVDNQQYDDLDAAAHSILFEEAASVTPPDPSTAVGSNDNE